MLKVNDQRKEQAFEALRGAVSLHPAPLAQQDALILLIEVDRLKRMETAARAWYDEECPAEEGHDQVYPWDHAP